MADPLYSQRDLDHHVAEATVVLQSQLRVERDENARLERELANLKAAKPSTGTIATSPATPRPAAPPLDPIKQAKVSMLTERLDHALAATNDARRMQGKAPLAELPESTARMMAREVNEFFEQDNAAARQQAAVASARAFNEARKSN
jgi:hypothetical protein